jgi:hypothetical protein
VGGAAVFFVAAQRVTVDGALGADLVGFAGCNFRFDEGRAVFLFKRAYACAGFCGAAVRRTGYFLRFVAGKAIFPDRFFFDTAVHEGQIVFRDLSAPGCLGEKAGSFEALAKNDEAARVAVEAVERPGAEGQGCGYLVRKVCADGGFEAVLSVGQYAFGLIDREEAVVFVDYPE